MIESEQKKLPAVFYRNASGKEPVRDWLKEQAPEDRKIIGADIATVEFGWPVGMPVCRPISSRKGLWEVRSNISDGRIARVLFCISDGVMVLLHGIVKKTQKTPDGDLKLAVKRMKEVENG